MSNNGQLIHWVNLIRLQGFVFSLCQFMCRILGRQTFRRYPVELGKSIHWIYARTGTSDTIIFDQVFVACEYSCIRTLKQQPSSIIDAGANVGFTAVYLRKYFPDSKIVSLEPDADNYNMLIRNTLGLDGLVTVAGAVWGETCTLSMGEESFRDGSACARVVSIDPGGLNAYCIEDLVSEHDLKSPIMVKIDIEGAETNVFSQRRADKWLSIVDVVIMEVHEDSIFGDPSQDIEDSMVRNGFTYTMSGELRVYTRAATTGQS